MEKKNKKPQEKTKDELLEEYLEANKDKKDCDMEDIMQDSVFLLKLWNQNESD